MGDFYELASRRLCRPHGGFPSPSAIQKQVFDSPKRHRLMCLFYVLFFCSGMEIKEFFRKKTAQPMENLPFPPLCRVSCYSFCSAISSGSSSVSLPSFPPRNSSSSIFAARSISGSPPFSLKPRASAIRRSISCGSSMVSKST